MMRQTVARPRPWSTQENALLDELYPSGGLEAVVDLLPDRSPHAIHQRAHKRGLKTTAVNTAPTPVVEGAALDRALELHDKGWAMARIARAIGASESATTNAVLIAQCTRRGFRPAERDDKGRLLPAGVERLRYMLKKGLRQTEIQLRLALSASTVSRERKRYDADLRARDKAPLPPPGNGEQYSGVKIPAARKRVVERALLEGHGAPTAARRAGVSPAAAKRIRIDLVKRLGRKGEALPGCNAAGVRIGAAKASPNRIPDETIAQLRTRLLAGEPVAHAAKAVGMGSCGAYRIRDALRAELEAEGRTLPRPIRLGRNNAQRARAREANWLPEGRMQEFRTLVHEHGAEEAKRILLARVEAERAAEAAARLAERARPKSFEEKLAMVASGKATIAPTLHLRRPEPAITLGGIASGAL